MVFTNLVLQTTELFYCKLNYPTIFGNDWRKIEVDFTTGPSNTLYLRNLGLIPASTAVEVGLYLKTPGTGTSSFSADIITYWDSGFSLVVDGITPLNYPNNPVTLLGDSMLKYKLLQPVER